MKEKGAAVTEYAVAICSTILLIIGLMAMFEDHIQDVFEQVNRLLR